MRVSRVALLVAIIATGSSALAESVVLTGKVTRATVYRGQAMVTRDLKLEGEAGAYEVVVADLPQHVVGDSLFAESGENAEVRAVRYRERAVGEEPREAVRQLDQQILEVTDQLAMVEAKRKLLNNQTEYLDKLEGFVAPTAKAELSKGVLDAEVLQQVTTFTFAQRQEIAEAEHYSQTYIEKILQSLRIAHIVKAHHGNQGGYVLEREAGRITLKEVIEALEGGLSEPAPLPCEARWSPRLVTLSVLVFCGGFWVGAGVLLSRLF